MNSCQDFFVERCRSVGELGPIDTEKPFVVVKLNVNMSLVVGVALTRCGYLYNVILQKYKEILAEKLLYMVLDFSGKEHYHLL